MDCVSLFSGAGGLDLGFRAAGFSLAASVEADADCCETLGKNGFKSVVHQRVEDWLAADGTGAMRPDVLFGGPPCQPFSKSAYWSRSAAQGLADKRAGCLATFFEAVRLLRPRCFLIENVPGFVTAGGIDHAATALRKMSDDGLHYNFAWQILNCADFGVPQKRVRVFGLGSIQAGLTFPQATHSISDYATAWDALRNLRRPRSEDLQPKGRWADLLATIPEGENYLWHTARGGGVELFGWRTRYWSFLQKLNKAAPAPTIVATPAQDAGPFHWTNRHLSTKELAALQTFPSNYCFAGDRASRRRQIGNAVPPLMGEILARQIAAHLGCPAEGELEHSIRRDVRIPKPARTTTVPAKYHALIGKRPSHPGTGRGPNPREPRPQLEARV